MPGLAFFQNGQKFTIYQLIYVINELVSSKKFTNARSLLSIGLLSSGLTVLNRNSAGKSLCRIWLVLEITSLITFIDLI